MSQRVLRHVRVVVIESLSQCGFAPKGFQPMGFASLWPIDSKGLKPISVTTPPPSSNRALNPGRHLGLILAGLVYTMYSWMLSVQYHPFGDCLFSGLYSCL